MKTTVTGTVCQMCDQIRCWFTSEFEFHLTVVAVRLIIA